MDAPDTKRYAACPKCGSKQHRWASTSFPMTDAGILSNYKIKDRICTKCGTAYHASLPTAVRYMSAFSGGIMAIFGFLALFEKEIGVGILCIAVGGLLIGMGLLSGRPAAR